MALSLLSDEAAASSEDWKFQLRHSVRTTEELSRHLVLSDEERTGSERAEAEGFPIAITPYYLGLADPNDPSCPIRRQVVPRAAEAVEVPGDLRDPLGEVAHE